MNSLRSGLYAMTETEAEACLQELLDSAEDYPNFAAYVTGL